MVRQSVLSVAGRLLASDRLARDGRTLLLLVAALCTAPALAVAQEEPAAEEASEGSAVDGFDGDGMETSGDAGASGPQGMREETAAATTAVGLGRPFPRYDSLEATIAAELPAFESALRVFEGEMEDYRTTISTIVETEYTRRREAIGEFYDTAIDELRLQERESRVQAVADFERFLERYPNDPEYTPDVVFRLAELHYEVALDNYRVQDDEYTRQVARYEAGIIPEMPDVPAYDFTRSIQLFDRLIQRFPDYRQIAGAYYLAAMCHSEMGEVGVAQQYFTTLVEQYPESEFAQESWVRIGEYHFDRIEMPMARAAYERAYSYGESRLYDKILFKLGWTNYLLQEYEVAIGHFRTVLDYYESQGGSGSAAVREESLQYFAISLGEADWDLDYAPDGDFILPRIESVLLSIERDYNLEVLDRLADVLGQASYVNESAGVYRLALERYPLDREAPFRHDKLIRVLVESGNEVAALEELERLSLAYAPESAWYQEQERLGNAEALAYADELARGSLLDSANNAITQARELAAQAAETGAPGLEADALARFRVAATLYEGFLERYPDADEAYEARALFAQALFYSQQYEEAALQFGLVRDSDESDEYRVLAAVEAIVSLEAALRRDIDAGRLEARAWPGYGGEVEAPAEPPPEEEEEEDGEPSDRDEPRAAPMDEPIPELSLAWVAANDRYSELGIVDEQQPDRDVMLKYRTGILFYRYNHFDAARERFISVIDSCKPIDETGYAAAFLIESYAVVDDLESLQFWSAELERRAACVPESLRARLAEDVDMMAMGQLAERADALLAEGRYAEAAQEFIRLANEYSDNSDTASRALFNAGVTYEVELREYANAMDTFDRIVRDYGETEFLDDALVRIAANSKQFFDFDRAISTYQTLDQMNFTSPGVLDSPLLAAIELLEATDRRVEAAEGLLRYVDENPGDSRNAEWMYRAALDYEIADNYSAMIATFDDFRRSYGNTPGSAAFNTDAAVVDSWYRQAMYYRETGNTREYRRAADNVLREFGARLPDAPAAVSAAAEIAYLDATAEFDAWEALPIAGSLTQQQRAMATKAEMIGPLRETFRSVTNYGFRDWSVCAYYMEGRVLMSFADTVRAVPPPENMTMDQEEQFFTLIDDYVRAYEDEAMNAWRVAQGVMMEVGVVNECTIDTIRRLNRYFPEEFPLFKQDVQFIESAPFSPQVFAVPPAPVPPPMFGPGSVDEGSGADDESGSTGEVAP
jgi:cellulose synthase operon protein C